MPHVHCQIKPKQTIHHAIEKSLCMTLLENSRLKKNNSKQSADHVSKQNINFLNFPLAVKTVKIVTQSLMVIQECPPNDFAVPIYP